MLVGGEGDRGPAWTHSHSIPETGRSSGLPWGRREDRPAHESPLLTAKGHGALWAAGPGAVPTRDAGAQTEADSCPEDGLGAG